MPNTNIEFKGFDDYIELFRSGEQTSSDGTTRNFTNDELDQMVANHKPAPAVIGHPKVDAPSYAWTQNLKREGDVLLGKFSDVEKQFEKMVEEKRFPNRSVRITNSENGWQLKHVGWLGAAAPAVEGLKPVSFNKDEGESFEFVSDAFTNNIIARTFRRLREFLITQFDIETADQVLPDYEVEGLSEAAVEQRLAPEEKTQFNKPDTGDMPVPKEYTDEQIQQLKDDAAAQAVSTFSAENTDLKTQLQKSTEEKLAIEYQAYADDLINAGKLTPAMATGFSQFMASITSDGAEFEFSQGEGDKKTEVKKSPLDWFKAFASHLPVQVDMSESNAGDELNTKTASTFNAPSGAVVDAERLAIHNKAEAYAQQNQCDYVEAVIAVS